MFSNGLLAGVFVGLAFMFLWRKLMRAKRIERVQNVCDNMTLASMSKVSEMEKLIPHLPKWVQFGEFEQVEWLNVQLKEFWPYVNKAVEDIVFEVVEGLSKQYEGGMIAKLQMTRADLGANSPQIRGVKVSQWLKSNQVVLDLEMSWQGNGKFKLEIVTATRATVKPCIGNLSFAASVRVILELTDKVPVIAAYVYALNRRPMGDHYKVTFDLTGAGLGAIPGLRGMIDSTIHTTVDDIMLWPRRQAAALIEGYDISHLELQYSGEVIVTVVKGTGLKNMDTMGKSDPRTALYIDKKHQFTTTVVNNNLNPEWKDPIQVFRIPVDDVLTATLYIRVEDEDATILSSYDVMGYASIPMADLLEKETETTFTLPLYNDLNSANRTTEDLGSITVKAIYHAFEDEDERKSVTEAEKNWKPMEESKSLTPEEAKEAVEQAQKSAKNRVANLMAVRGVGNAADKLMNLNKGKLAPIAKAIMAQKLTSREREGAGNGPSDASAGTAAAGPVSPPPLLGEANPLISRSTPVEGNSKRLATEAVQELESEGTSAAATSILATMSAQGTAALAETASVRTVDEEGKHGARHKVSTFFKGIKGGLRGSKEAGELEIPGGVVSEGGVKPPTPGSATPKRGIFAGFKGKEKKSAEI